MLSTVYGLNLMCADVAAMLAKSVYTDAKKTIKGAYLHNENIGNQTSLTSDDLLTNS